MAKLKKRQENEFVCRGYILNTFSNRLHDLYMSITSLIKIWKTLETTYDTKKQGANKLLMMKYFDFKMFDSIPIIGKCMSCRLLNLKVIIPKSLQVGTIISKLSTTWNDYSKKLLHSIEEFTIKKIFRHLKIEEESPKRDSISFSNSSNVNYLEGMSKKNKRKTP